jgi:hypothetical protein
MKAETIARALGGRKAGAGWMARCPAHDDHEPSDDGAQEQRHADTNSGSTATATARIRNGNASHCKACGVPLEPKRGSRRQRYCDYECRDRARRDRNFAGSGATRNSLAYPSQAIPRSVEISPAISTNCNSEKAGRAFPINLVGGHRWPGPPRVDGELRRMVVETELGATSLVVQRRDGMPS